MLILLLALTAQADDTFVRAVLETSTPVAWVPSSNVRTKLILDQPLAKHWSASMYFQVGPGYAEAYAGPSLHLDEFEFNVSVGLETAEMPLRAATWMLWFHKKTTVFACVEYGGTGLWYQGIATTRVGPVSLGVIAQRYDGLGPRVGAYVGPVEFYAAPLYDPEGKSFNALVGLNWTL